MATKAIAVLVLFLAAFLLIASEVAARDLAYGETGSTDQDPSAHEYEVPGGLYGSGYGGVSGGPYEEKSAGLGGLGRGGGGGGRGGGGGHGGGCSHHCGGRCCGIVEKAEFDAAAQAKP